MKKSLLLLLTALFLFGSPAFAGTISVIRYGKSSDTDARKKAKKKATKKIEKYCKEQNKTVTRTENKGCSKIVVSIRSVIWTCKVQGWCK